MDYGHLDDADVVVADDNDIEALLDLGKTVIEKIFERRTLAELKALIVEQDAPLWYQDEPDGNSPLHAAAYVENRELVDLLLENGAVWNAVDSLGYTAADVALSLNNEGCYRAIRDAGLRSEYLLAYLSAKEPGKKVDPPAALLLRAADDANTPAGAPDAFLQARLRFATDGHGQEACLVRTGKNEDEEVGVMMGWEKGISKLIYINEKSQINIEKVKESVDKLCEGRDGEYSVLNVGFGLGIIDSLFQARPTPPKRHVIIEAHPDVLAHMRAKGWYDRPGVTVFEGRWQDHIESEAVLGAGGFDVVYTDTFSEDYQELNKFFEHLPDLLNGPEATFSFFNGLGATNATFYDVYTQLAELHLSNVGINVSWSDVDVVDDSSGADNRWGDTRKYFGMRFYRLPIGRMVITA